MTEPETRYKFAVIGLSQFGVGVAQALVQDGYQVLGIDHDARKVRRLEESVFKAVVLDSSDEDSLRELNIASCVAVVVAYGDNFERNLLTTTVLKEAGVSQVIAVAQTEQERQVLLKVGADRVLQPQRDAGRLLARELAVPGVQELGEVDSTHKYAIIPVPPLLFGQSLQETGLQNLLTVMVIHRDNELIVFPEAETVLLDGDLLAVMGSDVALSRLVAM